MGAMRAPKGHLRRWGKPVEAGNHNVAMLYWELPTNVVSYYPRNPENSSDHASGRTDHPIAMLARMHAPIAIKTLVAICKDEKASHAARVSASQAILDRGYGRPASFSTGNSQTFKRAIDMTDSELAAIASGATLHAVE